MARHVSLALVIVSIGCSPPESRHRLLFTHGAPARIQIFVANGDGSDERPLQPATGLDYSPSIAPDGSWVVFTSERAGSADIHRVRLNGSALERLTDDPAYDDQAVLSPDGKSMAFVSSRGAGGATHIWLLDLSSRRTRALTSGAGSDFRPSWSPDSQWIAFSSDRGTNAGAVPGRWERLQSAGIYVVRADGTGLKRITGAGGFAGSPKWSPDGRRIIFYETTELGSWFAALGDVPQGTTQVASVDVASGRRSHLTTGEGIRLWPQPFAGDRLGFVVKRADGSTDFEVIDASGAVRTTRRGIARNPSWTADGARMVFHRVSLAGPIDALSPLFSLQPDFELLGIPGVFPAVSPGGEVVAYSGVPEGATNLAIQTMRPDGTDRRTLFSLKGVDAVAPVWSPAGGEIAFSMGLYFRESGRPAAQVATIRSDGANARLITDNLSNNGFPSYSPDGTHVVFKEDQHLVIARLSDKKTTNVTEPGPQFDNFPQWSPRGDRIAFTSNRDGDFEIYTVKPDGSDLRRLTHAQGNSAHAVWSPDGQWLVFSSGRTGFKDERPLQEGIPQPYGELFVMWRDGSKVRQLTDNQWEDATAAWMPDRHGAYRHSEPRR